MARGSSFYSLANSYMLLLLLLVLEMTFSVSIGTISNMIFNTVDFNKIFANMTCTECTCAALMNNAVGWNCMTNNGTCQLISNYSSSNGYFVATINGSFLCKQLPPEPFLKVTDTTLAISTTKPMTTNTRETFTTSTISSTTTSSTMSRTSTSSTTSSTTISSTTSSTTTSSTTSHTTTSSTTSRTTTSSTTSRTTTSSTTSSTTSRTTTSSTTSRTTTSSTTSRTTTSSTTSRTTTTNPIPNPCVSGNLLWNTTGITVLNSSQITSARGLYINSNNTLYVTDTDVIWKLLNNATNTTIVAGIHQLPGSNSTQVNSPQDVYFDRHGNMYVSDYLNHRIQKYINGSTVGITIAGISGSPGSALNQLNSPARFTFDSTDTYFYVADYGNHRVMQYLTNSTTGDNGILVAGGNGANNSNTSLNGPNGIHYLPSISEDLFIANFFGDSVMRWTPGASSGVFVVGIPGSNSTQLNQPRGIKIDNYLNMFVVDSGNNRVQLFCANNQTGITIAGTSIAGNTSTQLNGQRGVEFDAEMNMYITDLGSTRVQKFLKL